MERGEGRIQALVQIFHTTNSITYELNFGEEPLVHQLENNNQMPVYENHAIIFQLFPSQKRKSQIISY